ncbi:MAG: hypothetical protein AAGG54_02870 [Pseudomonadota bacterium]
MTEIRYDDYLNPNRKAASSRRSATSKNMRAVDHDGRKIFEDGYKAGWDDAVAQIKSDDDEQLQAARRALRDISVSTSELAELHKKRSIEFLEEFISRMVNGLRGEVIASKFEQYMASSDKIGSDHLFLIAHPVLAELMGSIETPENFTIEFDDRIPAGSVIFRLSEGSEKIDFDEIIEWLKSEIAERY